MHRIRVDTTPENAAIVSAEGELDAYAAPELTACFGNVSVDRDVVVDLSAVSFLDSTALGIVVRAIRKIGERGRTVRIVLPETSARRIFEITMLDQALPLAATREDALAELAQADEPTD
jgi:anti-sigma B factor antagonist